MNEKGNVSPTAQTKQLVNHLELMVAKLCWVVAKSGGAKKSKITDFLPKDLQDKKAKTSETKPASIQDVFGLLKSVSKPP